ncbi:MAG: hypothetical protein P4L22_05960 [Candidatus Babeliales bacterium]|nr:hypothetical protein [Candidatus Babeliales bacterium]
MILKKLTVLPIIILLLVVKLNSSEHELAQPQYSYPMSASAYPASAAAPSGLDNLALAAQDESSASSSSVTSSKKGLIFVFEGPSCSGKTTLSNLAIQQLQKSGNWLRVSLDENLPGQPEPNMSSLRVLLLNKSSLSPSLFNKYLNNYLLNAPDAPEAPDNTPDDPDNAPDVPDNAPDDSDNDSNSDNKSNSDSDSSSSSHSDNSSNSDSSASNSDSDSSDSSDSDSDSDSDASDNESEDESYPEDEEFDDPNTSMIKTLRDIAKSNINVIYDTVVNPDYMPTFIKRLEKGGYKVYPINIYCDPKTLVERTQSRNSACSSESQKREESRSPHQAVSGFNTRYRIAIPGKESSNTIQFSPKESLHGVRQFLQASATTPTESRMYEQIYRNSFEGFDSESKDNDAEKSLTIEPVYNYALLIDSNSESALTDIINFIQLKYQENNQ